ncbi:MAG: type II toxin-antitoxin system Phd/YefM family antitoxin [Dethiobacteria bacterium]
MKILSSRDLRQKSGEVWKNILKDDYIITSNGKPIAILTAAEDDPEMQLKAIRQARAEIAVFNMQKESSQSGLAGLSDNDIEAEINAARKGIGR